MPNSRKIFKSGFDLPEHILKQRGYSPIAIDMILKRLSSFGHTVHDWLDKIKKKIRAVLPDQKHLEQSRAYHIFGTTLFKKELWSFKGEAIARGLGLGLFVAFTPTIGFQMIIVCVLILFIPGNLPMALVATWSTNVFTAGPIYFFEYRFGQWLIEVTWAVPYQHIQGGPDISDIYNVAGAMWLGSLAVSLVAGFGGYLLTLAFVNIERRLRMSKIITLRSDKLTRKPKRPDKPEVKNNQGSL